MTPLRIGVIGGGSIFTPELVALLGTATQVLGPIELRLMDIDAQRLSVVGGLCERIVARGAWPIAVTFCATYEQAIDGADFVLVQFRVGGEDARIRDDRLGLKHAIPFVETVTVCGVSAFLRTYYELERIAELVARLAPDAWVMEFANPAGMLAEALSGLGVRKVVGVCNSSIVVRDALARALGAPVDAVTMNWRGLNHLTCVDDVVWNGEHVYPRVAAWLAEHPQSYLPFPSAFIETAGFIPSYYLRYHFFAREVVEELQARPVTRAEEVKAINAELLAAYATAEDVPDALRARGGYGYSRAVVSLIRSLREADGAVHYVNVPNGRTLPELPPSAYVEVPVVADGGALRPLDVPPLPDLLRGLLVTMKQYETTLIDGARTRDRDALLRALLIHPLIGSYGLASALLDDILEVNRSCLPADLVG